MRKRTERVPLYVTPELLLRLLHYAYRSELAWSVPGRSRRRPSLSSAAVEILERHLPPLSGELS